MNRLMKMTMENKKISFNDLLSSMDNDLKNHSRQVGLYALAIAIQIKSQGVYSDFKLLNDDTVHLVTDAIFLHDIGKELIPHEIINKQDELTYREKEIYQCHTTYGAEILKKCLDESQSDCLQIAMESALSHHERYDGQGYPNGYSGQDIPLIGRICAVADAYVHYTSLENNLRLSRDDAINEILKASGTKFDPIVVDAFIKAIQIVDCCH